MNTPWTRSAESDGAAFQKVWLEPWSKAMQAAFGPAAGAISPELLGQLCASGFEAFQQAWSQYLNLPQLAETLKPWMPTSATAGEPSSESPARERNEMPPPAGEDWRALLGTVQRLEALLSAQVVQLSQQTQELSRRLECLEDQLSVEPAAKRARAPGKRSRRDSRPGSSPEPGSGFAGPHH